MCQIKIIVEAIKRLFRKRDYVEVGGSIIASPDIRWCGEKFKNNEYYLESAEREAKRLNSCFGCRRGTAVLDIGCGQGRLPIGILRVIGDLNYIGIDIDLKSIEWCKRYIEQAHATFQFKHINAYNERYNENGAQLDKSFMFPVDSKSVDIVYLYSVFSHTSERDMRIYLGDILRILRNHGGVFFTTFVEENVPNITINPDGYVFQKCSGPYHVVRYNKDYLFSIVSELGYSVQDFTYKTEADGQSAIYLRVNNSSL